MSDEKREPNEDVMRVWECVNDFACNYADDRLALETMFEGVVLWADRGDMLPGVVAWEFLNQLEKWIKERNRREGIEIKAIREVIDEHS